MNIQSQKFLSKNLSQYEILGPLGRGSHSFVYKAKYIFTDSIVALKVIDISTAERLSRAKREVRIHKSVNHEGIVSYIDDFKDDSYWYLVLEYCEKGELYSCLKKRNFALAEVEIRSVGLQLLRALEYLESRNIVHLDIKLGNVLVKQPLQVKLGDFGFSECLDDPKKRGDDRKNSEKHVREGLRLSEPNSNGGLRSHSQTPLAKTGKSTFIQGTPNYIAPEMIEQGIKSYKADIWSLGCLFYALATGKTPFEGKSIDHTFQNIVKNSVEFPQSFSQSFKDVIRCMLDSKASRRRSAKELLEMPFFAHDNIEDNTLSTIATEIEVKRLPSSKRELSGAKPSYLNQVDKKTINDIVKKSQITRNKSFNTEPSEKNLIIAKSIKSKRLINEMLAKQSSLAATLQAKYVIGKLDTVAKISMPRYQL